MVRHSEREVLNEASISQFLTRLETREGREAGSWVVCLAGLLVLLLRREDERESTLLIVIPCLCIIRRLAVAPCCGGVFENGVGVEDVVWEGLRVTHLERPYEIEVKYLEGLRRNSILTGIAMVDDGGLLNKWLR